MHPHPESSHSWSFGAQQGYFCGPAKRVHIHMKPRSGLGKLFLCQEGSLLTQWRASSLLEYVQDTSYLHIALQKLFNMGMKALCVSMLVATGLAHNDLSFITLSNPFPVNMPATVPVSQAEAQKISKDGHKTANASGRRKSIKTHNVDKYQELINSGETSPLPSESVQTSRNGAKYARKGRSLAPQDGESPIVPAEGQFSTFRKSEGWIFGSREDDEIRSLGVGMVRMTRCTFTMDRSIAFYAEWESSKWPKLKAYFQVLPRGDSKSMTTSAFPVRDASSSQGFRCLFQGQGTAVQRSSVLFQPGGGIVSLEITYDNQTLTAAQILRIIFWGQAKTTVHKGYQRKARY